MRMSSGIRFSRGSPEDTRPLQFEPNTFGRYRDSGPLALGLIFRDAVRKRGEEYNVTELARA